MTAVTEDLTLRFCRELKHDGFQDLLEVDAGSLQRDQNGLQFLTTTGVSSEYMSLTRSIETSIGAKRKKDVYNVRS